MFTPKIFEIKDSMTIEKCIHEFSFATLISAGNTKLDATHLPLLLSKDKTELIGHMARPNNQWSQMNSHSVLAIFQGPHHYISPSWYETMDSVPTWNYVSIHVYGKFSLTEKESELIQSLEELVMRYEDQNSKYELSKASSEYLSGLQKGIVGFKIKIDEIQAKAKLSQNHSPERRANVIKELNQIDSESSRQIAQWMRD
jgi:transcriptional regulator